MDAYLINLKRRPDRLARMTAQLAALGVPLRLVDAIDAHETPDSAVDPAFAAGGPLGVLPKGDKCCTLSHKRAWRMFLGSGDERALILEDDVEIDAAGAPLLRDGSWIPAHMGLLKIERFGPPGQRALLSDMIDVGGGRRIGRLRSKHTGGGAYVLDRRTAQTLLDWRVPWALPIDHMLFNPNNSPLFAALAPWQLVPVIARQTAEIGGGTDIEEWRKRLRGLSGGLLKRELVRAWYDVRLLPRQIAAVAAGKARLVRVDVN